MEEQRATMLDQVMTYLSLTLPDPSKQWSLSSDSERGIISLTNSESNSKLSCSKNVSGFRDYCNCHNAIIY